MITSNKNQLKKKLNSDGNFNEGDIVHLLAPGDPREKRNDLKPRHANEPDSPNVHRL